MKPGSQCNLHEVPIPAVYPEDEGQYLVLHSSNEEFFYCHFGNDIGGINE